MSMNTGLYCPTCILAQDLDAMQYLPRLVTEGERDSSD